MVPDNISFQDFEVPDIHLVLDSFPANKPCFWPDSWTLVIEDEDGKMGEIRMFAWMRDNCAHRWDSSMDNFGKRIFAFESEDEAMLFKLSF